MHGDDSTVPILAKGKTETGRIWVYGCMCPVSLRDISKIDCHNAFFRNAHGDEVPELDRLSVKTWHIAMSHCFIQLNDAIQTVRNHMGENGKPDDLKNFLDDLKTAQAISGDVYVNASLYRTTFLQRLMELKTKEVVYYAEASSSKPISTLREMRTKVLFRSIEPSFGSGKPGFIFPMAIGIQMVYFPFRKRAHLIRTPVTPALVCRSITAMVRPCQHSTKAAISAST